MSSCLQIALVVAAAALLMPMSARTANLPTFQVNGGEGLFEGPGSRLLFGAKQGTTSVRHPLSGMAGGISYPSLLFGGGVDFVGSPWIIPNAMDPILKEAFNTNGGSLWACVGFYRCSSDFVAVFNVVFVPTGEVTIALQGPNQDGFYLRTSAVYSFGTTPEPSSIMLFGSGILGLAGVLRRSLG